MSKEESGLFYFAVCQVGAEAALKKEIAREHPELRPAFSRPGFVTFKQGRGESEIELRSVFARVHGQSLGRLGSSRPEGILPLARSLRSSNGKRLRLHVWARDLRPPGEEAPLGPAPVSEAQEFRAAILRADALQAESERIFEAEAVASPGDLVLDVIWTDPGLWWIGWHRHTPGRSPFPAGCPELTLPPDAPSRAYLKLEESLLWSGLADALRPGEVAVELGSAPGGASYALVRRGLRVIGIDPGEMDPRVARLGPGSFTHIRKGVSAVRREELPEKVHWLLADMNVPPEVTLTTIERLVPKLRSELLGVILTLKLNQWKFADQIPAYLKRIRSLEMARVRAGQLSSHRQEFLALALTRKGRSRVQW